MNTPFFRWLPLLGLLLFAGLVVGLVRPPRPVPATAPATEFSAARALADVAVVARQPHPLGSPAQAAVRDYLLRRCRALGVAATVQDTSLLVADHGQVTAARIQNVVARLPGRQPGGKAVLVLAHYDSQPHTPGAGDDGAGVAAMLETLRALRAGPPLANDVIWLFSDGEEAGLLGARAFAADTARLRRAVGVALNFEGRGNAGPSLTFEVSPNNGWVMREYAQAAPAPIASSLFYEAYRHLPNNTDFTPLRQAGLTGLNFAFVAGYPFYHSPADTPGHLSLGSLQHHGSAMLSLVRHFSSISLAHTKGPDETFFNPLGTWLVHYPASWNLGISAFTILLLISVLALANFRSSLGWGSLLGGALAWLGGLLLLLAAGWGLLALVAAAYPQYGAFYDRAAYNAPAYQVALLALGGAIFTAYYGWLSRYLRPGAQAGGALLVVALLLGLLQWRAASSAFLLSLPLLAATLAWALRLCQTVSQARPQAPNLVGWLLALPAVALLGQVLYLLLILFGLSPLVLLALALLAVLLGLLLPLVLPLVSFPTAGGRQPAIGWGLPGVALGVMAAALAVGHATRQPTADQPQQAHLFYALDAARGQAYWLSAAPQPSAWTRRVLTQPHYGPLPALFPQSAAPILYQAAPRLALAAPTLTVLADSIVAGRRQLTLRLRPGQPEVSSLSIVISNAAQLRGLRVAGHPLPAASLHPATGPLTVSFFAPRPAGEILVVRLAGKGPLQLAVTTRRLGLPAAPGLPPLPATVVPAPGYNSFTTQVRQEFAL
ncbi:M20/M25/M40 family metallo-hydrolase [Hymenobacter sp. H14-R3]|uniref:M20/M25/M40 family metallo-hydrolase n=1 Tax=Hymenobacter sp. H14-R3 TaxID=3046308 RepID=UPI0024BB0088|nr:M20/M25/M40 family metallo-hydrolase [Hymenobacter sp. H14-R3]MDJ0365601.1 M20/M25/M40 family metallo-hydrolase [Hymenobacter sp. H14-R3]